MAQLRWEASAQVGASKRWLTDRPSGPKDAWPGPSLQLASHITLIPLVQLGAYVGHELSPMPGDAPMRHLTSTGLRIKGIFPFLGKAKRAWIFAGFGHAWAYAPGFDPPSNAPDHVASASGRFFEVPLGLGAQYKFFDPWAVSIELGVRLGLGHKGALYVPSSPESARGLDAFAAGLWVGIAYAR
jgi:hypothetical protein